MVECLEVAIDGREVIAAAQCSDGGLPPSELELGCDPLPEVPGEEVWSGAAVPFCCGVPVCGAVGAGRRRARRLGEGLVLLRSGRAAGARGSGGTGGAVTGSVVSAFGSAGAPTASGVTAACSLACRLLLAAPPSGRPP